MVPAALVDLLVVPAVYWFCQGGSLSSVVCFPWSAPPQSGHLATVGVTSAAVLQLLHLLALAHSIVLEV